MLKWFNKKKKDNKGFTLVELIIVVAILAILVGLLAPQYTKYVEKSRQSADASNLEELVKAIEVAASDPEVNITAAKYTITIASDGTTVTTDNTTSAGDYLTAIKEYTGYDFSGTDGKNTDLKLKSAKWTSTTSSNTELLTAGTAGSLIAVVKVGTDGSVEKAYAPDIKNKMNVSPSA